MKISVIVTTWGVERFAASCLDSVRKAAAVAPFEVEVVEVSNANGPGAARNEGLQRASGDYVWFVDGDDLVAPWTFEVVRPEGDIVHFGHERFADGDLPRCARGEDVSARTYDLDDGREAVEAFQVARGGLLASSAWYRRAAFGNVRFGSERNCEDTAWGMRCFFKARTMSVFDVSPYGYRLRAGSASARRGFGRVVAVARAMVRIVFASLGSRHRMRLVPRTVKYAAGMVVRAVFPRAS